MLFAHNTYIVYGDAHRRLHKDYCSLLVIVKNNWPLARNRSNVSAGVALNIRVLLAISMLSKSCNSAYKGVGYTIFIYTYSIAFAERIYVQYALMENVKLENLRMGMRYVYC